MVGPALFQPGRRYPHGVRASQEALASLETQDRGGHEVFQMLGVWPPPAKRLGA